MIKRFVRIATVAALAVPFAANAQGLSDDELSALFETQRQSVAAVQNGQTRSLAGNGDTRGIKLHVIAQEEAPAPQIAATDAPPEMDMTEIVDATSANTYVELPKEMQVNVQIRFDYDSAALRADQKPKLDQLCRVISSTQSGRFRVVGHTDATGSDAYNQSLSLLRAQEVQRFFTTECGIDASRIDAMGVGEKFLADDANPAAEENRRVEFLALS